MLKRREISFQQIFLEWGFVLCRVLITYLAGIVFLALPPVVSFNQFLTRVLSPIIPALSVERVFSLSTLSLSTQEGISIVWLGARSSTVFSPAEYHHLLDVHQLLIVSFTVVASAVALSILTERAVVAAWLPKIYHRLALLIVGLTVVLAAGFPVFFELFHHIFFPQGNYAFPVNSYLIQSFPPLFWLLNFLLLQASVIIGLFFQAQHAQQVEI